MKKYVFVIQNSGIHKVNAETPEKAIEIATKYYGDNIIVAWDSETGIDINLKDIKQ